MCCMYTVYSGMQEWVIQIPSIPILVSVLFPSLHLKYYFRIKFLLLVHNIFTHVLEIVSVGIDLVKIIAYRKGMRGVQQRKGKS